MFLLKHCVSFYVVPIEHNPILKSVTADDKGGGGGDGRVFYAVGY